jgi:hypothetical protein
VCRAVSSQNSLLAYMASYAKDGGREMGEALISSSQQSAFTLLMGYDRAVSGGSGAGFGFSIQCDGQILFSFGLGVGGGKNTTSGGYGGGGGGGMPGAHPDVSVPVPRTLRAAVPVPAAVVEG